MLSDNQAGPNDFNEANSSHCSSVCSVCDTHFHFLPHALPLTSHLPYTCKWVPVSRRYRWYLRTLRAAPSAAQCVVLLRGLIKRRLAEEPRRGISGFTPAVRFLPRSPSPLPTPPSCCSDAGPARRCIAVEEHTEVES